MKILVANKMDWNHPKSGGTEVNLRETLSRLSDRGHEIHLITSHYPGAERSGKSEGVHIHRYGIEGRTNEIFILTVGQIILNYWIKRLQPDVIYTVTSVMTWIPVFQSSNHLVSIHHLNRESIFGQFKFPMNIAAFLAEKLSLILSRNKQIMTVSPATSQDLIEHGIPPENITEILNGIDYSKYDTGENAEKPEILYLGRLEYNKGADLVPDIFAEIENLNEEIKLQIAGRGRKKHNIENFAASRENVNFNGYVTEERKQELLKRAWIVIIPSRREGWGLTVAEANASGTPVVSFDSGGLEYSVTDGKNGKVVETGLSPDSSTEDFAEQAVNLIEDAEKRMELEEKAKKSAEERSWDETVDDLEKLLEETAGQT